VELDVGRFLALENDAGIVVALRDAYVASSPIIHSAAVPPAFEGIVGIDRREARVDDRPGAYGRDSCAEMKGEEQILVRPGRSKISP
jgi:hypothetical protein